ncbi:MAG: ArnT family glycosyltransferase [Phycisphaerales bacterium]
MERGTTRRDLLLLGAVCAVLYGVGLTNHGLTNWQEAQRAVVAREMQANWREGRAGALAVPTNCGRAYLAKPPMMYWAQVALAEARGARTGEFELRAVVAISGMLGVLATYWCVLTLLSAGRRRSGAGGGIEETVWSGAPATIARGVRATWEPEAALWAGLCLATGVLYVRSSRIGELDILLVPSVALAIGGIGRSWRRHLERGETDVPGVVLATIGATAAVMTKGPAGAAVIALGAYGGMGAWTALTREPMERFIVPRYRLPGGRVVPRGAASRCGPVGSVGSGVVTAAAALAGLVVGGVSLMRAEHASQIVGAVVHAVMAGVVASVLVRLAHPQRALAFWASLTRTHPVGVLGVPMLVFWWWWSTVRGLIGTEAATTAAMGEAEDNLHWLTPGAAMVNVEALVYGVGLGSVACGAFLVWMWKDRPRVRPGWVVGLAWLALGSWVFALSTKGVIRYLTPVWPAVAMLGGIWIATRILESRRPRMVRTALGSIVLVLAVSQAWWYGYGREVYYGERSPRALVREAVERFGLDPARMGSFELRTPALDYYAGTTVSAVGEIGMRESMSGVTPLTLDELRRKMEREREPMAVFLRISGPDALGRRDLKPAVERLAEAGFTVSLLNTEHHFITDSGRSVVGVAVVDVSRR